MAPSSEELLAAVKEIKERNPEFGLKRVLTSVKEASGWEVSEKRVKKVLQSLTDEGCGEGGGAGIGDGEAAGAAAAGGGSAGASSGGVEWVACERPTPRSYFTVTALEGSRAAVFGGEFYDNQKNLFYNDLLELDVAAGSYRRPAFTAAHNLPPARSAHQACVWQGSLYVFGGESSAPNGQKFKLHDDLWRLDLAAPRWERVSAGGGPSGRSGHRMVCVGDKLVLYGGMGDNRYFSDLHVFDLGDKRWLSKATQVATANAKKTGSSPGPRSGFVMFADGDKGAFVWGGTREKGRGTETLADMWRLDASTLAWERIAAGAEVAPSPRSGVGSCVVGGCAVLCGGVRDKDGGGEEFSSEIWQFDMGTRAWGLVGEGAWGGRRNAGVCGSEGVVSVVGGLREEGEGKQAKELTLDDVWLASVTGEGGQGAAVGSWKRVLPLSGAGDDWKMSDGSDGSESEGGDDGDD